MVNYFLLLWFLTFNHMYVYLYTLLTLQTSYTWNCCYYKGRLLNTQTYENKQDFISQWIYCTYGNWNHEQRSQYAISVERFCYKFNGFWNMISVTFSFVSEFSSQQVYKQHIIIWILLMCVATTWCNPFICARLIFFWSENWFKRKELKNDVQLGE